MKAAAVAPPLELAPDLAEAGRFIAALTGSADTSMTWQTLPEGGTGGRAGKRRGQELQGTLEQVADKLIAENRLGRGIFVCINDTGGRKRTAENIKAVRALYMDWDSGSPLDLIATLRPVPHIVVESSTGKAHAYWLVSDCGLADFKPTQQALAARYGADPAVCDLPRIMRVSGFLHCKHDPFLSHIVSTHDAPPYTLAQIKTGLLPGESTTAIGGFEAAQNAIKKARKSAKATTAPSSTGAAGADQWLKILASLLPALKPFRFESNEQWQPIAMSVHSECIKHDCIDEGYALLDKHAQGHKGYDEPSNRKRFYSFSDKVGGVAVGTLYRCALADGWQPPNEWKGGYSVDSEGVRALGLRKGETRLPPLLICGPLTIAADATDKNGGGFCRLLKFTDRRGTAREWLMPLALLAGDGAELRAELLSRGLWIADDKGRREHVMRYINSARDLPHITYTDTLGWFGGVYVLPDRAIGTIEGGGSVIYRGNDTDTARRAQGTPDTWRAHVAALAAGNPRLAFAISAAFAAPLLHLAGIDGGGIHFSGGSSQGKTSIVRAAASVWGAPDYVHTWRATANGIEGTARQRNDGLLILDELNQVAPGEAGETAYMLANGRGKSRMSRTGEPRPVAQWRLLYLSTGELGLEQHAQKKGQRVEAGQMVRLAEIPADAGEGFGIYDTLHGRADGAALSNDLVAAAAAHYGTAGIQWLEYLTANYTAAATEARALVEKFTADILPPGAEGQAIRGAQRFALIAAAGEMATAQSITGWKPGEALAAARRVFADWIDARGGGGNQETRAILQQVRGFLEKHGTSRFIRFGRNEAAQDLAVTDGMRANRAGYVRYDLLDGPVFYVLSGVYAQEVCAGRNKRDVSKVLQAAGWLPLPGKDGKSGQLETLPDVGRVRVYELGPKALQGEIN